MRTVPWSKTRIRFAGSAGKRMGCKETVNEKSWSQTHCLTPAFIIEPNFLQAVPLENAG